MNKSRILELTNINLPTNEIFVDIYNTDVITNGMDCNTWWIYNHGLTNAL